jgi:outer membrane immunogenic protein
MKKFLLATTALAALTGSAFAADLPARTYTKAPPVAVAPSWTGFYIFGGAGGGVWDSSTNTKLTGIGTALGVGQHMGGDGWFGTVGAGYDWQFNGNWVVGVFGDGQFGSMRGTLQDPTPTTAGIPGIGPLTGTIKDQDNWAAGVRLGYLIAPNVLSYVNGGYSGSHWSKTAQVTLAGFPSGIHTNNFNLNGGFVGGGVENNLNIFGITAPGWFMKTEYRAAYYGNKNISELFDGTNLPVGRSIGFKPLVQTVETSLVYRFNWTGPVVAKY